MSGPGGVALAKATTIGSARCGCCGPCAAPMVRAGRPQSSSPPALSASPEPAAWPGGTRPRPGDLRSRTATGESRRHISAASAAPAGKGEISPRRFRSVGSHPSRLSRARTAGNDMTEKVCTGCGRVLALAEFVRDARTSDGRQTVCRSCMSERVLAGKRNGRVDRWDHRPWHRGCSTCGEYERNNYPGRKCRHRGAVQGATRLDGPGNRVTFIPEGHELFPDPPPWSKARVAARGS